MSMAAKRIGLIGCGAIGRTVLDRLGRIEGAGPPQAVLVRPGRTDWARTVVPTGTKIVTTIDALIDAAPDLIVECAGHEALALLGPRVLARGTDLLIIAIGALADPAVERSLREATRPPGGRLMIPAGAIGGLDLLASARTAGLDRVAYTSRKKPLAWKGTKAEQAIDLDAVSEAATFYRGMAR